LFSALSFNADLIKTPEYQFNSISPYHAGESVNHPTDAALPGTRLLKSNFIEQYALGRFFPGNKTIYSIGTAQYVRAVISPSLEFFYVANTIQIYAINGIFLLLDLPPPSA
jgi:hypothetical protein